MKKNFRVEFSSFLTKKEREILKKITDMSIKNRNEKIWIKELNLPKTKNNETIFFEKINRKSITLIENNKMTTINYLKKFEIENDYIYFELNEEFLKYFTDKKLKEDYSFYDFLFLNHQIAVKFFFDFIINNLDVGRFTLTVSRIKNSLEVENYTRFYDLERYVLNVIRDDFKDTKYKLVYKKIKKMGRIEAIEFTVTNKKTLQNETSLKILLFLFKKYIKNKEYFSKIIREVLEEKDSEYVKEKIIFAIKIQDKFNIGFEKLLELCIKKEIKEKYVPVKKINYKVNSIIEFQKYILKDIKNIKDNEEIFTYAFSEKLIKSLYELKEESSLTLEIGNMIIYIYYSSRNDSTLNIYKKILDYREE